MSRRRWLRSLTFAALLVTPLIVPTQGGWLLMFPPETPSGLPDASDRHPRKISRRQGPPGLREISYVVG
jgi:hypothetical protein